jgi:CMP-N-acetylneuraminic acid synthetase
MTARQCGFFDHTVVSTESREVMRSAGVVVCHVRPDELSQTESNVWDAVKDYMETATETDYLCLLHPTSPCLRYETLTLAIDSLTRHPVLETYISVNKVSPFSWVAGNRPDFSKAKNTQAYPPRYALNNAFIISTWDNMRAGNIYGSKWAPYTIPADEAVDIDTETDLQMAEAILQWRQNEAEKSTPRDIRTRESTDEGQRGTPVSSDD